MPRKQVATRFQAQRNLVVSFNPQHNLPGYASLNRSVAKLGKAKPSRNAKYYYFQNTIK